ncbi:MAG TPA: ABC transporter substrate-binding protein [Lapillicoccus sp.]|nr:ABC transporter substrate-binding protein [Lapillicoccus sp.]
MPALPTRRAVLALPAVAGLVLVAACGTTEAPVTSQPSSAAAAGPVTVTDARGKTVTLPAPATRVVATEWSEAEQLVTLGVAPVGVADPKGYATWASAEKLPATVADVGTRTEPSVDAIVALKPDLVVVEKGTATESLLPQLEQYVPAIVTTGSDATRNMQRLRDDFTMIATATGTTAKATAALAAMDKTIADARAAVTAKGKAGTPLVVTFAYEQGGAPAIRVSGKGSLVQDLGERIGLTTAWTGEVDKEWGLGVTDVEGLKALTDPNTQFFYFASDGTDLFTSTLAKNPIWTQLPFVTAGNVAKLPDAVWAYGGPASAEQFVGVLVDRLTGA